MASRTHVFTVYLIAFHLMCISHICCIKSDHWQNAGRESKSNPPEKIPKIAFGIDYHKHLNPKTSAIGTNSLFDIYIIIRPTDAYDFLDVIAHSNYSKLAGIISHRQYAPSNFIPMNISTIDMFEDKGRWKQWMNDIGLGEYVPKTYSRKDAASLPYPVFLKFNGMHNGWGVHIVQNSSQLHNIFNDEKYFGRGHTIEEALTGMGLDEVSAFGSVYKGKLLSLRCVLRTHYQDLVDKRHNSNSSSSSSSSNGGGGGGGDKDGNEKESLFVRGFFMRNSRETLMACSQQLVDTLKQMFAHAGDYTGPFCADIKANSAKQPKMMEINARFCYTHRRIDPIFLSSFVPLAMEIRRRAELQGTAAPAVVGDWYYHQGIYKHITDMEQRVLREGGGGSREWSVEETVSFDTTKQYKEMGYEPMPGFIPPPFPK